MIAFTYSITHKFSHKKYYGSRYSKTCKPTDLGTTYFSSSKIVKDLIKQEGIQNFEFKVRRIFPDAATCRAWEEKFLRKVQAVESEDWYNKSYGNGNFLCKGHSNQTKEKMKFSHLGKKQSEITKKKISQKALGREKPPVSIETREKQSISGKGRIFTDATKLKQSISAKNRNAAKSILTEKAKAKAYRAKPGKDNHFYGKIHSKNSKKAMSESHLALPKISCEYCGKTSKKALYVRWHGKNCVQHIFPKL